MKKLCCLLLCLLLTGLAACGGTEPAPTAGAAELDIPDVTQIPRETPTQESSPSPDPEESAEPTPTPVKELSLDELWDQLEGVWTHGDDFFVLFYEESGTLYFNYAQWYSEFPRNDARATDVRRLSDRTYQVSLYYDAVSDDFYGELDPMVSSLVVDLGPAGDNKISVQVESGTMYHYTYGGANLEDALARLTAEQEEE